MIGIGVIGYGYWGPNLVRNFFETPDCEVVAVSDLREKQLARVRSRYPTVSTTTDYRDLLNNPRIDAVVVATPVSTHFDLAMQALRAGKHVLVEKPMTMDADQGQRLVEEAERRRLKLAVDHTFVFTSAVRKIRDLAVGGDLGDIYYYDSVRVNLGLFQHDVNVIWDLAVHDLAIMDFILAAQPVAVSATGISHVPGEPENMA
ncbi:MAG TPA: Gfo/Idh/MocA family oxidoreductase, partial [Vicinamibacterales bacterium]|nr:Gfo/Idh/MocA family oxidoreductase [Vicinamibacterales bacterium]